MALTTGTPATSTNPSNLHDRLDEQDSNMHFPKGYRSAENGYQLRRGADGEIEYDLTNLPAALDFGNGGAAPASETNGDVYILSSSFAELTCSAIAWQSGTTVRYSFSGSPDLSSITTSDYFVISTAANSTNNGRFGIDNRTDATDDESSVSFACDVSYRDWDGAIKNEWVKYDSTDDGWYRVVPVEGVQCYLKDEDAIYTFDGSTWNSTAASGFVTAPSSTDNAVTRFDGTAGQIQDSGVTLSDADVLSGITILGTEELRLGIKSLSATTGTIDMDNNDLNTGSYIKVTATGNITLNQTTVFTTAFSSIWYLEFTQDGSGGHTLTLGTNILTPGGVAVSVSTGAGDSDVLVFQSDSAGKSRLIEHRKSYS
jgi:hypothetical protein